MIAWLTLLVVWPLLCAQLLGLIAELTGWHIVHMPSIAGFSVTGAIMLWLFTGTGMRGLEESSTGLRSTFRHWWSSLQPVVR